MKESYENMKFVLEKLKYSEHIRKICGDVQVITLLLGLQLGCTKFGGFICQWDSRNRKSDQTTEDCLIKNFMKAMEKEKFPEFGNAKINREYLLVHKYEN